MIIVAGMYLEINIVAMYKTLVIPRVGTVNRERFAKLIFCGFHPMKFSRENCCGKHLTMP